MNIKELRDKTGLSQQEMADETGIPKGRINQWEQKNAKPKTNDYNTLRNFFIQKGVWPAGQGGEENEDGLLYKHAYEGARREIQNLKEAETLTVAWREENVNRLAQIDSRVDAVVQGIALILAHLSDKEKDPEVILKMLDAHSEGKFAALSAAISARAKKP